MTDRPDPALKGIAGGNCNREACQRPLAIWFNKGTNAYYCMRCAHEINRYPLPDGSVLCARDEAALEKALEREERA